METVAPLAVGETAVQAEGGKSSATFGAQAWGGSVRARRGVAPDTDVSAEVSYIFLAGEAARPVDRGIYAGRIGAKQRLTKWLGVTGGLGGGGSAGGGFVSPDVGPIIAYENRYCVPFVAARGGFSVPIGSRSVDTTPYDSSFADPTPYIDHPRLTWFVGASTGVRVPLGWDNTGTVHASLLGAVGLIHLADVRDKETLAQVGGGAELAF